MFHTWSGSRYGILYSAQLSCAVCGILRQVRQSDIRICLHSNTLTWITAVLDCEKCSYSLVSCRSAWAGAQRGLLWWENSCLRLQGEAWLQSLPQRIMIEMAILLNLMCRLRYWPGWGEFHWKRKWLSEVGVLLHGRVDEKSYPNLQIYVQKCVQICFCYYMWNIDSSVSLLTGLMSGKIISGREL